MKLVARQKLPVSAGAFSFFSLEPFCMAHSLIMEGENAPRGNVNGNPSWGVHSLKGESRQRWEKLSTRLCDCNPTATAVVVGADVVSRLPSFTVPSAGVQSFCFVLLQRIF